MGERPATPAARMNATALVARWRRRARLQRVLVVAAGALPLAAAVAWLGARHSTGAALLGGLALGVAGLAAARSARAVDARDVARRLDAEQASLEDSAALLVAADAGLNPIQRLQRERVRERVGSVTAPSREPVPWRAILACWIVALVVAAAAFVPLPRTIRTVGPRAAQTATAPVETRMTSAELEVVPPAYTGLPPRRSSELAARVEAGARVRWRLAYEPVPDAISLAFHDGEALALARDGDTWHGERTIAKSTLYRIELAGVDPSPRSGSHRLEVVPDRPPEIRVVEPERTLTPLAAGQRTWPLAFEASDDYGVGAAELSVTNAKGTGENITVLRATIALRGEGDARARRYRHAVALAPYALEPGDDLIARLTVRDNRTPEPQLAQSASYILRAPFAAVGESSGVEGLVRDTLPAYFRSQRQVIIDTEALVAESAKLSNDVLVDRSDAIGVDQRILRLRYGQFLGEQASEAEHDDEGGEREAAHADDLAPGATAREVLEAFGHTHDDAEAATLLDPETKKLLRAALGEMWDAERRLRSGQPRAALPYEHRALELIKQVQQASRIYLARVGLELPQLDEARRMTGEREGARDVSSALVPADVADEVVASAWAAHASGAAVDVAALRAWARAHESALSDPLGWFDALDRLEREPSCAECREALGRLLWSALPTAPARARPRDEPDRAGRAYLESLEAVAE